MENKQSLMVRHASCTHRHFVQKQPRALCSTLFISLFCSLSFSLHAETPPIEETTIVEESSFISAGCEPLSFDNHRRRPGYPVLTFEEPKCHPERLARANTHILTTGTAVPDRWRIVDTLGYPSNWWDPYSGNNVLKGDKPLFGKDWFVNLSIISDTVFEPRRFPVPVGNPSTKRAGSLDLIGDGDQVLFAENLIIEGVLYQGDTVFRPPDYEFRIIPVINYNTLHVEEVAITKVDPNEGTDRYETFIGLQGLFIDKHLWNVSDRYDFDSLRVGIQPFTTDFRGFLFQDNQFGVRLFGTRNNNIFQYNLAWFRRLEKDTNSGLNDPRQSLRDDDVFAANVYWQDFPVLGFFSQAVVAYNRNREKNDTKFDDNGFIARPASLGTERNREYDVVYVGLNGDGHFGRLNVTTSLYYAFGDESNGTFVNDDTTINAYFGAIEASMDFDWLRLRVSGLHGSGDDDPFDDKAQAFDAIFENPLFAGADTSYFIRQTIPLIGGGRVALSGRNGVLNSLRSSKELGQSNFTNPGINLVGLGADADFTPKLRISVNANQIWFDDTAVLEVLRQQKHIDNNLGQDLSMALIYRPLLSQNIVVRLSGAILNPGEGFRDLYGEDEDTPYSILGNLILAY